MGQHPELSPPMPGPSRERAYLAYYTYNPATDTQKLDVIAPARWRRMSAGGRLSLLQQMFYANTRTHSRSGLRHQACYTGNAPQVIGAFFAEPSLTAAAPRVQTSASQDGLMIGVQFTAGNERRHFRLTACHGAGKGPFFSETLLQEGIHTLEASAGAQPSGAAQEAEQAAPAPDREAPRTPHPPRSLGPEQASR